MRQGGIAEAFDQCLLVRDDVDTRGQLERGRNLLLHQSPHEGDKVGLRRDLIDIFVTGEITEIRER